MKKRILLLPASILMLTSCSYIGSKHEVELTTCNYATYFDIEKTTGDQITYSFSGCLDYAYYDNVQITFNYYKTTTKDEVNIVSETIYLNAAGNGVFNGAGKYYGSIQNIKGVVIYWL